jgi:hypothetical protein
MYIVGIVDKLESQGTSLPTWYGINLVVGMRPGIYDGVNHCLVP